MLFKTYKLIQNIESMAVTYLGEGGVPEICSASHGPKASSAEGAVPLGAAI